MAASYSIDKSSNETALPNHNVVYSEYEERIQHYRCVGSKSKDS